MASTVHTATGPNGEEFKRTSKTRTYSHVVIAKHSHAYDLRMARGGQKFDRKNYQHYASYVDGSSHFLQRRDYEKDTAKYEARVAHEVERAREALAGAVNENDYVAIKLNERLAAVEARLTSGRYERFVDLGWTSRLDLANTLAKRSTASGMYEEVQILEATRS